MNEKDAERAMELIYIAGNSKSIAIQSIILAEDGKIKEAKEKFKEAKEELHKAHDIQTTLLNKEVNGEVIEKTILLIHAQDHFMSASTVIELTERFIRMYERK
ncbi:PTS lactose/cellobiose transporter subunit IIA [Clostridium felsineum]|uniref:Lichenan-specific phosphotransferase enzyme IIA component n=1 Tax=Clostridium felsineum TaxID=36839 RepID=A0A1S8LMR3_9CLOT|nr:PTS lactose/cellobiose transporter subunit IIA [Clostridium felsineum]MCR3760885.1 PTS lactose/cellobiose transporter subunit IIA [Clostridium felsineum]URZ04432.1 Lichenan-specific phosphotransferase enzyme IIA component [Clostridium felsineum]URZ07359.1 Lichenan-specific phosphotransferase enzyme IIA component [Clostridium felsineum]URZ12390.1 Lichenan-specific phosphotransferase enzyme IIA component [Clostridium felsineum]